MVWVYVTTAAMNNNDLVKAVAVVYDEKLQLNTVPVSLLCFN